MCGMGSGVLPRTGAVPWSIPLREGGGGAALPVLGREVPPPPFPPQGGLPDLPLASGRETGSR